MVATHSPSRLPATAKRVAAAFVLLVAAPGLGGCGSSDDSEGPGSGASTSLAPNTPFAASITGPGSAEPGNDIIIELSNDGRLPDAYQLVIEPTGAAAPGERDLRLSPGESLRVKIAVTSTPFVLKVNSVGAGGEPITQLNVS